MKATSTWLLAGILLVWQLVSAAGVFHELFLPSPMRVLHAFNWDLAKDVIATLTRTFVSFCFGVAGAYGAIFFAHAFRKMALVGSQFAAVRAVPMLATIPLLNLWFGSGETIPRVVVISLTVLVFVAAPLAEAILALQVEQTVVRQPLCKSLSLEYWNAIIPETFGAMIAATTGATLAEARCADLARLILSHETFSYRRNY